MYRYRKVTTLWSRVTWATGQDAVFTPNGNITRKRSGAYAASVLYKEEGRAMVT